MTTTSTTMKSLLRAALALSAAALLLAPATPAAAQADFSKVVSIGASVDAGFLDGCWVQYGQVDGWTAIFARQAKAGSYEQPLLGAPGAGGCMYLTSLAPTFGKRASVVNPLNLTLPRPYDNLSIPGYLTSYAIASKSSADNGNGLTDVVLRGLGATQVQQAASLKPTFVTIGVYANEALGPASYGTVIDGVTLIPAALYEANYKTIVDTLKASQGGTGKGVAMLLPDVSTIAFTSTVSPVLAVVNGQPITALSMKGGTQPLAPVPADSLLTLNAAGYLTQGYGIPCAVLDAGGAPQNDPRRANCNKPLPDNCDLSGGLATCSAKPGVVLYPDEVALLKTRTDEFNAKITALATAAGYKVFDTKAFFNDLKAHGRNYGGMVVTTAYLQGGFFSYDGVHPTSLGYAITADEFIQFVNKNYGTNVPRVPMYAYLANGNTSSGGYPLPGVTPTQDQIIQFASQIFTPETWAAQKTLYPMPTRPVVSGGEVEVPVVGARKPGVAGIKNGE